MSVCNLYKEYESGKSIFYTFSEYNNDLAKLVSNTDIVDVKPERFICCNLSDVTDINIKMQNYDNITCIFRDENINDAKKYYLGTLINILGLDIDDPVCVGNTSILNDESIDGNIYEEFICYLNPTESPNYKFKDTENSMELPDDYDNHLCGYEDIEFTYNDDIKQYEFEDAEYTGSTYEFNCIIPLYTITYGDKIERDIPLGIYIANENIVKYITTESSQGSSYALRICTRFASTIDGNNYVPEVTGNYDSFVSIIGKMTEVIDKTTELTNNFIEYNEALKNIPAARNPLDYYYITKENYDDLLDKYNNLLERIEALENGNESEATE